MSSVGAPVRSRRQTSVDDTAEVGASGDVCTDERLCDSCAYLSASGIKALIEFEPHRVTWRHLAKLADALAAIEGTWLEAAL